MLDRRRCPRTPTTGRIYLTFDGRCRAEQLIDLSPNGVGLQTALRLRPGLAVTLYLPRPSAEAALLCQLKGLVARRTRQGTTGIALTPGARDARHLLRAHLAGLEPTLPLLEQPLVHFGTP